MYMETILIFTRHMISLKINNCNKNENTPLKSYNHQ